jgi:uncharacterized protein (TIGR02391 family)
MARRADLRAAVDESHELAMANNMPISSLVPNADDLLHLEVEEVAGVLLTPLNSSRDGITLQHGVVNRYNFFNMLNQQPEYRGRQDEVNHALMEAWGWLQNEGFLVPESDQEGRFFISRRARQMKSREDFGAYRKGGLLPKGQLHPLIATKVYPAFLRGEYDTAVFQAFREVEVAVRRAGKFPDDLVGKDLMRDAFRPANPNKPGVTPGPLTDITLPIAEQEGMASLFDGAIRLYKNPQSHRNVPTEAIEAAEVIVFASHLLRMVDRLTSA